MEDFDQNDVITIQCGYLTLFGSARLLRKTNLFGALEEPSDTSKLILVGDHRVVASAIQMLHGTLPLVECFFFFYSALFLSSLRQSDYHEHNDRPNLVPPKCRAWSEKPVFPLLSHLFACSPQRRHVTGRFLTQICRLLKWQVDASADKLGARLCTPFTADEFFASILDDESVFANPARALSYDVSCRLGWSSRLFP